jgi:SOS-response transcriptional repressor LexA
MSTGNISIGIGAGLKAWRESKGLSQAQVARSTGLSQGFISSVEAGKKVPGTEFWQLLWQHDHDFPLAKIITGHDAPVRLEQLPTPMLHLADTVDGAQINGEDYLAIPLVDGAVAAGEPRAASDVVEGYAVVYRPLVKKRKNMVAVRVKGDSMDPVITDGSIVIIDRDDCDDPQPGKPYALRVDHDGVTIKFVGVDGGGLWAIPANRDYMPTRLEGGRDACVGRVIFSWREW